MFRKIAKLLLFLLIGLLLSGFRFGNPVTPLYDNIKEQAQVAFSDLFHRDVKIKSAGGRIAGQIVLKGVAISPDLKAEIVKLNFSIAKYILNKGDITPALSSIEIEGANVRVTRDKNNNINLVSLFVDPNAKSDSSAAPPPKINIKIKDSKVNYIDQAGIYEKIKQHSLSF